MPEWQLWWNSPSISMLLERGSVDRDRHKVGGIVVVATPHILVVEDDVERVGLLLRHLCANGCHVSVARDGRSIVILGAKGADIYHTAGLKMTADPRAKAVNRRELPACIRAVLRRTKTKAIPDGRRARAFKFVGRRIDRFLRELKDPHGIRIALTRAEFDLLQARRERPDRTSSHDRLLDLRHSRSTDVLVDWLRHKLECNPHDLHLIKTAGLGGYVFAAPVALL